MSETPVTQTASQPVQPETVTVPKQWDWEWTLDCGDAMPSTIPVTSAMLDQNWNWNWNWNCGAPAAEKGNSDAVVPTQYQPVIVQYQPSNINISIRIGSAGNDGPVTQTNVAIHVGSPASQSGVEATQPPSVSGEVTVSAEPADESSPAEPVSTGPPPEDSAPEDAPVSVSAPAPAAAPIGSGTATPVVDSDAFEAAFAHRPIAVAVPKPIAMTAPTRTPLRLPEIVGRFAPVADITALTPVREPLSLAVVETPAASGSSSPATARHFRPEITGKKAPLRNGASAIGLAGGVPAGASGRDVGLLAVVLLFFVFFVDALRRVTGVWSPPSAELGRRPERPG